MKNSYFELYEVLPNFKRRLISDKSQFGDLAHAKKAGQEKRKEEVTWQHGDDPTSSSPTSLFYGYVGDKLKFEIRRISKRKTNMTRKKKRSAKQLANDRRLGRMAKARAKKKRGGRRKVAKRKTKRKTKRRTVRRANPKKTRRTSTGRWFQIFKCKGASVHFLALTTDGKIRWTLTRGDTVRWSSKAEATKIARRLWKSRKLSSFYVGVAGSNTSASAIVTECKNAGK